MPTAPEPPRETPSQPVAPSGAPVTAPERTVQQDFDPEVLRRMLPPYKVVVHNNEYNTFDEVIHILVRAVPGMSTERAADLANEIHVTGAAVPYVGPQERAEAVASVIRTIGIKVTVEPDS